MAGDFDCCTEPINRQEHAMTSPTQRRHDEILGRLDALIDAVQSTTYTIETRTCRKAEPVDVTEEPPVGSQVTDKAADVWQRFEGDDWRVIAYEGEAVDASGPTGVRWSEVRNYAPLRPTTDADRERVGLPVDTFPDVDPAYEARPNACCGKCPPIAGGGYDCTCVGNPRCAKADTPEEWHIEDVDPDEALAKVLCRAWWGGDVNPAIDDEAWTRAARAAREHIYAEPDQSWVTRDLDEAEQRAINAEADVKRLTRERDEARSILPRLREALDGLRYYYTHHPAESVNTDAVARRIHWRMRECGAFDGILMRDDERGRTDAQR